MSSPLNDSSGARSWAVLALLALALFGGITRAASPADAPAPAAESPAAIALTVEPASATLRPGEEWIAVTYRLRKLDVSEVQVQESTSFFHSLKGSWQSEPVTKPRTDLKFSQTQEIEWKERIQLPREVLERAQKAGAIDHGDLLYVQSFALLSPAGEVSHVSTSVVLHVPGEPPATDHIELPHYQVTVLRSLRETAARRAQLAKLLTFAEAAYEKLSAIVGFTPNAGRKVPLHITGYGGFAHYQPQRGGYVSIPCDVLESQSASEWLYVAYPHELTHYFLLEEFPNPPRWFIEGPASFFGTKVADALGYTDVARDDRARIMAWAANYTAQRHHYLFTEYWPGDAASPGEEYAFGLGRGYELCEKLEQYCGPDIFRDLFRHLHQAGASLPRPRTEKERNEMLIAALQSQTKRDLRAFFAREGFSRK